MLNLEFFLRFFENWAPGPVGVGFLLMQCYVLHANNPLLLDICTLYRDLTMKRAIIIWYK